MNGITFLIGSIVFTFILYLLGQVSAGATLSLHAIGQLLGVLGLTGIAWSVILSLRHRKLENFFGGLDTVYRLHHIVGGIAFILIMNHPLFFILSSLPFNMVTSYLIPNLSTPANALGILAFYTLILLIVLTLFIDLPYALWKKTHEWMGVVIILVGFHYILEPSALATYLPLRIWLLTLSAIAVACSLYKRWFYYRWSPSAEYSVSEIESDGRIVTLRLTASLEDKNPLVLHPGQFVFVTIGQSRDEHPFSVVTYSATEIVLGYKIVGPFTRRLSLLKPGTSVILRGPFGSFGERTRQREEMIWIAGGIGITPFITMAQHLTPNQTAHLIYATRGSGTSPLNRYISQLLTIENLHIYHHDTAKGGRLTQNIIAEAIPYSLRCYFFLCGPLPMMESITDQLVRSGIPRKHIIYEDFALK